jgi:hypothetical protein
VATGSSSNPHASEMAPIAQCAGAAIAEAWLVVIRTVSVPVALVATELVNGLKTHAAYAGRALHWNVNAAEDPLDGVSVNE